MWWQINILVEIIEVMRTELRRKCKLEILVALVETDRGGVRQWEGHEERWR